MSGLHGSSAAHDGTRRAPLGVRLARRLATRLAALGLVAALGALAGCGSSGGDSAGPGPVADDTAVPASAVASVQAFGDYLAALLAADESHDALGVADLTPPTDDGAEPRGL